MTVGRLGRVLRLVLGNLAVFALLFALLELSVRIARDGLRETSTPLVYGEPAPYSNIGTGKWVIHDPELGYRLNPEQEEINALSIRHGEITIPKPDGLFRVIVLGDSIPWASDVFGFVADVAKRIAARGVEVINAAVPGYTSFQELAFFKRYLMQVDPDLVVWSYCLNDNHKFLHRFDQDARMLFTDEAARSLEIRSWWDWVVSRSYVLTDIRVGLLSRREPVDGGTATFPWEARQDFNIAWKDYSWRSYEGQLSEMVDLLKRRGTRLAIVIFPFEPQLLLRTMRERRTDILAPQRRLKRLCRKYAVPCLDLYPSFARAYDQGRTLYRDGIHPNQDGHTLAATKVLRFLDAHRLLPAPAGSVAEGPR